MRRWLVLGALLIVPGAGAGGPTQDPQDPALPAAALLGAERGPLGLALVLAQSDVPGGVVTTEAPGAARAVPVASPDMPDPTATAVAARLAARHPDYEAAWRDGIFGVDRRESACGRAIDRTIVGPATIEGNAAHLLVLLGWMASRDAPPVHRGVISQIAVPGDRGASADPPRALRLVLPEAFTLRQGLDQLVRENRNGVWIAWQHRRVDSATGCRLAAYYAGGIVAVSSTDFAVLP